jgi:hypothetical protein
MLSRGFTHDLLCLVALRLVYWVHGVDLHRYVMRYCVPPVIFYLPHWLTHAFSLSRLFLVAIALLM